MSAHLKYQGQEKSRTNENYTYKETWQGTETEVDSKISAIVWGTKVTGKGYPSSYRKSQSEGKNYQVEIDYSIQYGGSGGEEIVYGQKTAQLSTRNMQMPLESLTTYKKKWNYYLLAVSGASVPSWWDSAGYDHVIGSADYKNYRWSKDPGELQSLSAESLKQWQILKNPIKPGTDYYDKAYFVVSEVAKYGSASSAGSAVSKAINTITEPTEKFGITGGNWKLDDCQVSYNGKYWLATETYTHSPDGWDTDLYN